MAEAPDKRQTVTAPKAEPTPQALYAALNQIAATGRQSGCSGDLTKKDRVCSHNSGDTSTDHQDPQKDQSPVDQTLSEENSDEESYNGQGGEDVDDAQNPKTFQGIPSEWHETIKVKN